MCFVKLCLAGSQCLQISRHNFTLHTGFAGLDQLQGNSKQANNSMYTTWLNALKILSAEVSEYDSTWKRSTLPHKLRLPNSPNTKGNKWTCILTMKRRSVRQPVSTVHSLLLSTKNIFVTGDAFELIPPFQTKKLLSLQKIFNTFQKWC